MELKIILIEDQPKEANQIQKAFTETFEWLEKADFISEMKIDKMTIEYVKGSLKNVAKGEEYLHYKDSDISKIKDVLQKYKKNSNIKVAFLTDVLLTQGEVKRARVNDFSDIGMVNKICEEFEKDYPMYFITGLNTFGSRVWSIIGKEHLSRCYIQKELIDISSRKAMARVIYWLANKENIPCELKDKIEQKELEEKILK